MKLNNMVCSATESIRNVMQKIDNNAKGTVFLIDDKGCLCGVVTDGDIRRALLDGAGLNETINTISSPEFEYAFSHESKNEIYKKFNFRIRILPIVDDQMRIVDYSEFNEDSHISLATPQLNGNEYKYLMDAFLSTWISSSGKYVTMFEESFSRFCGVKYGIATSNGTTALHLALVALGIGSGDEVIVPDLTFAATINSVIYTGATPVIVDIEEDSWCIDLDRVEEAVTSKTKAIIPVHLYGQPCDMGRLMDIADKYDLYVVEDCAEAHGAEWGGRKVGNFGVISCFSFFGNKVITTGEGGMCVTDDEKLNNKMRVLRDHGMKKNRRYYHEVVGFNYRMTNMQAAIGAAQIEHIVDILQWRQQLETMYVNKFSQDKRIILQKTDFRDRKKIAWLVSVLVDDSVHDKVINTLKDNDIDVRAFFIPLSKMDIYKKYALDCPVSERISKMGINLPTTYEMNEDKVDRIYTLINTILDREYTKGNLQG